MLPATFHLRRSPWEGRWLCRLWNIEPWGLLRKDHLFFSLGFVPCPVQFFPMPWSSFLLPFPFTTSHQNLRTCFTLVMWWPRQETSDCSTEVYIKELISLTSGMVDMKKKKRLFSKQVWGSPFYDWQLLSKFWWFYMNYFTVVIEVVMRNTYVCVVVGEGG